MLTKKYFSIAEASKISCLSTHKLRYIEKTDANIEIVKIRGRRYYTKKNIDYIKQTYSTNSSQFSLEPAKKTNFHLIFQIDQLRTKFLQLMK